MDRRLHAVGLVLAIVAGACGADVTPGPVATDSEPVRPTAASPSPTPSASPTPSPAPTATPLVLRCPGTDKTPGKHSPTPISERSQNWAGYIAYDKRDKFSCVVGSWTQPSVTCSSTGSEDAAIWVGIDGVDDPATGIHAAGTLVQIGTQAGCDNGKGGGFGWYQVLPDDQLSVRVDGVSPNPGDTIRALVRYADGVFTLQLLDETTGESFSIDRPLSGAKRQTVEWVVEAPMIGCPASCHIAPLPKFGTIALGDAEASSGSQLGAINEDAWKAAITEMVRSGVVRATVSKLSGGDAFTVTWKHR